MIRFKVSDSMIHLRSAKTKRQNARPFHNSSTKLPFTCCLYRSAPPLFALQYLYTDYRSGIEYQIDHL